SQYSRNASDGAAWLGTVDGTLQTVNSRLQRVRDPVLQGESPANLERTARQALATEVTSLRGELMGLANTSYAGRPVFGGTTSSTKAYDESSYAYLGNDGQVTRRLDSATTVEVGASGRTVFGDGAQSMFKM